VTGEVPTDDELCPVGAKSEVATDDEVGPVGAKSVTGVEGQLLSCMVMMGTQGSARANRSGGLSCGEDTLVCRGISMAECGLGPFRILPALGRGDTTPEVPETESKQNNIILLLTHTQLCESI
jgi:hypothetical protein